ncbi:hypothetical protein LCL98_04925 [Rossellomorea aquimaris]|nr:hypothetical protein [Rossellomorea aquimaris]
MGWNQIVETEAYEDMHFGWVFRLSSSHMETISLRGGNERKNWELDPRN